MLTEAPPTPVEAPVDHDPRRGVYDARRAAALSGVPKRTLHHWAQQGWYRPSIAPDPRPRLWSWLDLLVLRTIDWLRHPPESDGLRGFSWARVRQALEEVERLGLAREALHNLVVRTEGGDLLLDTGDRLVRADGSGQLAMGEVLHVVRPYMNGPDLLEPRPLLRIIPGKLSGEPHVLNTRIPSQTLFALHQEGYSQDQIQRMYPEVAVDAIQQAINLEQSLSRKAA